MTENPYASEVSAASPEYVDSIEQRPSRITMVGVLALILASLGLLGAATALASPMLAKGFQQSIIKEAEEKPDRQDLQMNAKMQKDAMELSEKYYVPTMVVHGVVLLLCLAMFVGAILLLTGSATGRALLASLFLVMLVCDTGKAVLTFVMQREQVNKMNDGVSDIFAGQEMPEDTKEIASTVVKVFSVGMVVLMAGWFLVKVFFYFWAWKYLKKPEVVAWFANSGSRGTAGSAGMA